MSSAAGPEAKRRATERRPRDMIISLAVLLVPIALIYLGWQFLLDGRDVQPVDVSRSYAEAERAGLETVEPTGLREAWVPISQSVDHEGDAVTLRIGYQSPREAGVQLVESNAERADVIDATLGDRPRRTGEGGNAGRDWDIFKTVDGHNAYVSTEDDMTIVVVGDASLDELNAFMSALN